MPPSAPRTSTQPAQPWRTVALDRDWRDLVLPEPELARLRELAALARSGVEGAIMALLVGEPGTGKTLVSTVLARDLGVPLIEVDALAAVQEGPAVLASTLWQVQHLGTAEHAVLAFDAASVLIEARTADDGGSPAWLALTRYPGMVILCSRVKLRLRAEQSARLHAIVHLPFPDVRERLALWRAELPGSLSQVELTFVADSFRLTGGAIAACAEHARRISGGRPNRTHVAIALNAHYERWVLAPATRAALAHLAAPGSSERGAAPAAADTGQSADPVARRRRRRRA